MRFSRSTRVGLTLGPGETDLYYSYRVDDGDWMKVQGTSDRMMLAEDLDPSTEHVVRFGKCDESSDGVLDLVNLELDGGYTVSSQPEQLVYHAIGDSITAGFKAECSAIDDGGPECAALSHATENIYNTYVRHLADAWGTDLWSSVARTGAGVGDIYVTTTGGQQVRADRKMLDYYKCREFYGGPECYDPWDFASEVRKPNIITINLGTNDYTYENFPSDETFQGLYVELIQFVQNLYPDALVFCIAPLQYTIAGPRAGAPPNKWTSMVDNVKAVVDTIASDNVIFIATGDASDPPLNLETDYVDDTHPTAGGHAKFAEFLEPLMTPAIRQKFPDLLPEAREVLV